MPDATIEIQADRRLAFEVLTAWGALNSSGMPAPKTLRQENGRLLVEFHAPIKGLFGRTKVYTTVEWVTPREPEQIEFEGVKGPLPLLRDRFVLETWGDCTRFRYESTFGVRGWWPGWIIGKLYVEPIMKRHMRHHVEELKKTIEARAQRSKVYPQKPCPERSNARENGR